MPSAVRMMAGQLLQAPRDAFSRRALMLSLKSMSRRSAPPFQPYSDTGPDRYPTIFARFGNDRRDLTVLSFGCSVGDELISLRRYFPRARIVGVDASRGNVRESRRRIAREAISDVSVHRGTDLRDFAAQSIDIIFAMAVFRHGALSIEHPPTCRPFISFEAFDAAVADLVRCLRVGGTLVIEHSNFRVTETSSAHRLASVYRRERDDVDDATPAYGADGLLRPGPASYDVGFRLEP